MSARTVALGAGTAVTTFLLAGAAAIELLGAGKSPAIGIIGVFVGVITGIVAGAMVSVYAARLSGIPASALVAYATFGVAFVVVAGMRYVNVPYADDVFTFPVQIGASVTVAVVVALAYRSGRLGGGTERA
jgi:hypothetical protein